jgi:hypothetical protein
MTMSKDERQLTASTRFFRPPSGVTSSARKPVMSSKRTTPKLYTSLFLVTCGIKVSHRVSLSRHGTGRSILSRDFLQDDGLNSDFD